MDPKSAQGAFHIFLCGVGGAITALVIATLFPSIIPARAAGVNL